MRTLPTRAPQFFLLAALVVLGQGPANAQSPSCDSTEGSEACLPWGHHKLLEIGEIYDISRDGSVALGAHRPVYPDYKDAVVHYSNTAGYTEIQHVWSVQHVQIMWDRPQMSSDGRFVLGSARPPEVGGQTQDYRAIRWDTQTNTVDFLPTTTSSHATNVDPARVDGEL